MASFVIAFTPGCPAEWGRRQAEIEALFEQYLVGFADNKLQGVGAILGARSLIQFHLIDPRGTEDGWRRTQFTLARAKEHFEGESNQMMVDSADSMLRELPFKRAQWGATAEGWQQLLTHELSDEYIRTWWMTP